jgi:iron complex outermembrane recepter protein
MITSTGLRRPGHVVATSAALLLSSVSAFAQATATPAPSREMKDEEVYTLSTFQVSGKGDRGYGVTNSIGASRINLELENISTAVATLNRAFQDDIAATNLIDAIKYVSGVDMAAPLAEQWSQRGTGTSFSMLDGVPDPAAGNGLGNRERYDPMLTERIEVLKGPVGTLYGAHSAGGLINRVSKFPLAADRTEIGLSFGSNEQKRVDADTSGTLDGAGRLRYRVIGSWQDGEYTVPGSVYDSRMISPIVSYNLGRRSKVWGRFTYRFEQRPTEGVQNWFLDSALNVSYFVPRDRALDNTDATFRTWFRGYEGGFDTAFDLAGIEFATRFVTRYNLTDGDSVQYLKSTYRFKDANGVVIGTQANTRFDDPRLRTIDFDRRRRERADESQSFVYNWDLSAKFDVGPTRHMALTYFQGGDQDGIGLENVANYAASNVDNPVYFANGRDGVTGPFSRSSNTKVNNTWWAWGAHDNVFLFDDRIVLAGGARFDHQDGRTKNQITGVTANAINEEWSYKLGVIGKPMKGVALFYNYSETYVPINSIDPITGQKFPNQNSTNHEGGVKVDLFDSRVAGTFSVFDILQDNVLVNVHDPVTGLLRLTPLGNRVVRGWEADFDAQPIDALNLKVGVGSIDKAATETGLRPRWVGIGLNYKGFAKYTFRQGPLKNFAIGAGVVYTNDSAGDATDTFTLPGYALYDGLLQYSRDRWSIQLNVYNMTDKVYAITSVDRTRIYSGEPRNAKVTWRYRF